jgi:hypothetical protein
MAQAVNQGLLNTEVFRVQVYDSPCEIYGEQSDNGRASVEHIGLLISGYHFTNGPKSSVIRGW